MLPNPDGVVTFDDSITGSNVPLTGTVTYSYIDGGTVLQAQITTSTLPVGTHIITAYYNGTSDPNYMSSNSESLTLVLNADPTTITVVQTVPASPPNTSTYGNPNLQFKATVSADTPENTPAGWLRGCHTGNRGGIHIQRWNYLGPSRNRHGRF
jgi:hypothetical protein